LDPDDVIRRDPAEWRGLVEAAEPVVAYVIRVLTAGRDLDDPKVKTEIAATVLPLIEDVAQPIERDTYRQKLARVLRVDERALSVRPTGRREPARRAPEPQAAESQAGEAGTAASEPPAAPDAARTRLEAFCLGRLLLQPALLYRADRELQALGLAKLADDDFVAVEHQLIFNALSAALEQVDDDPADHLAAQLDPALHARLEWLRTEAAKELQNDIRTGEALIRAVLQLRRRTVSNWLRELRFLAEDAREQGDQRAEAYQVEISRQAQSLAGVDRALAHNGRRGADRPQRIGLR
jgi:DNA primase